MAPAPAPRDARPVDQHHGLDDAALGRYISEKGKNAVAGVGISLPVRSTKIGYGQSNPTYFVDDASGTRFILRKKPTGTIISPVAHQVDREFRVLQALGSVAGSPVPKVLFLCMDTSVIGTAFYMMEHVRGRIVTDMDLSELSPPDRRKAWFSAVETLAWLHSLDPDAIGLGSYGKKTGFYARHCNTFSRIEAQQAAVKDRQTGEPLGRAHDDYDRVMDYVKNHLPAERYAIMHGDFKFDNLILHPIEPTAISILDWELSTIGHPLTDVVFLTSPFWNPHAKFGQSAAELSKSPYRPENRTESGMPELDELLDHYASITGFHPRKGGNGREWEVAKVFHLIRGATITHGIRARTISGQASSEFSHVYFDHTKQSLDAAVEMVRELERDEDSGGAKL